MERKHKTVQALQRGLQLLEAIALRREGASLKDLAGVIDISSAATYHLLGTLVEAGYVQRLENPVRYQLGGAVAMLAVQQEEDAVHAHAHALMKKLGSEFPEGIFYLCENFGDNVVITSAFHPSRSPMLNTRLRQPLSAYASAGSLCHMAFWPQEKCDAHEAGQPFDQHGLPYWRSRETYEAALSGVRQERIAVMPERSPLALKVGVPLLGPGERLFASLTIQFHLETAAERAALEPRVRATAIAIGRDFTQLISK